MAYGTVKADSITFTSNSADVTTTLSGIYASTTNNLTLTGTASAVTFTGTTANFVSGVFSTQVSGATVIAPTGTFTSLTGTTATFTSGIIASGTAALPSLAILSDPNTGIFSPGADQLAVATNGTQRLLIDSGGITSANGGVFSGDVTSYGVQGLALTFNSNNSEIRACRSGGNYSNLLFFTPGANSSGVQAERVRITTEGLVGIGTSAPGTLTHLRGTNATTNFTISNPSGLFTLQDTSSSAGAGAKIAFGASYDGTNSLGQAIIGASKESGTGSGADQYRSSLVFHTSNFASGVRETMRLDPDGRVGIGTTSPAYVLDVASSVAQVGNATDAFIQYKSTAGNWHVGANSSNAYVFYSGTYESGNERARIDSSGRLLVGTSTARASANGVSAGLQVEGLGAEGALSIIRNGGLAYLTLGRSGGASIGSNTAISNNDELGRISWAAADGTDIQSWAAQISAEIDGTPGSNDTPGRLVFSTTADGSASPTERMRISANGNVNVVGALSKGSGSFRIDHPLSEKKDTHHLIHSFIEGPQADLIYRGHVNLINGKAIINIDDAARMAEGTFNALCTNVCCFTSNESDWTAVRGSVSDNILTIEAQDLTSTAEVCWMVIGERKDQHMLDTNWTDENGRVITEPLKEVTPSVTP